MFSFLYVHSDLGYWYIIWKVNTRNRGMNLRNTLCTKFASAGRNFMGSLWPGGKWIGKGKRKLCMLHCHSCYYCGTWGSKEVGGLKLSYGVKRKNHKQEELLWGAIRKLPRKLTTELLYLDLPAYFSLLWCKNIYARHRFLLTKSS